MLTFTDLAKEEFFNKDITREANHHDPNVTIVVTI